VAETRRCDSGEKPAGIRRVDAAAAEESRQLTGSSPPFLYLAATGRPDGLGLVGSEGTNGPRSGHGSETKPVRKTNVRRWIGDGLWKATKSGRPNECSNGAHAREKKNY
jgi:hypothetical protein